MSIFLLVRFVTSVTREKDKKSLFPLCDDDDDLEDAWPFSPAGALCLLLRGEAKESELNPSHDVPFLAF